MFTQKIYQTYEGRQNILNVSRQQNISNMCRQAKFVRIKSSGEVFYHYRAKVNKKIENVPFSLQIVITIIIMILLSIN